MEQTLKIFFIMKELNKKTRIIMKNKTITITTIGLLTLMLCGVCFYYSCKPYSDCSKYELTAQEIEMLSAYNQGDIAVFKNDSTFVIDTLHVIDKYYGTGYYSESCNKQVNDGLTVEFNFSHLNGGWIQILHVEPPLRAYFFPGGHALNLIGTLHSLTINGIYYNDVFETSIDSTTISSIYHDKVPWKINYSQSKGFVRFYMVNGQTWSKQ
jgi:hypothetical protein